VWKPSCVRKAALHQMSEDLARARKSTKLEAIAEQLGRALQLNPTECAEELERIQTALAEAHSEWDKISDLHARRFLPNMYFRPDQRRVRPHSPVACSEAKPEA